MSKEVAIAMKVFEVSDQCICEAEVIGRDGGNGWHNHLFCECIDIV
jgi:hypothetical protein